jgi:hypothetical protein
MGQHYSSDERERDPHKLPDIEVFQLTAAETAAQDEDLIRQYSKRHEFRLCNMNSRVREAMLDAIVEEEGIEGGWFWWYCFPGCMPEGPAMGPFSSYAEALQDARSQED